MAQKNGSTPRGVTSNGSGHYEPLKKPKKSLVVAKAFESIFKKIGLYIAVRPYRFIVGVILATVLCSLGFLRFNPETRPGKLWIPSDSDYLRTEEWKDENFHENYRRQMLLVEADNVLTPAVISELYRVSKEVSNLQVITSLGEKVNKTSKCLRIPELAKMEPPWFVQNVFSSTENDGPPADWSLTLSSKDYCQLYDVLPTACLDLGILDVWKEERLGNLTQQDIINDINTVKNSATFGFPLDFTRFVGGAVRNETGHIIAAKTLINQWILKVERTNSTESSVFGSGLASMVDEGLHLWEGKFIQLALNASNRVPGIQMYPQAKRSFEEVSSGAIMGDVRFLALGNMLLFMYVFLMLGKLNVVETRPVLSLLGFLSIYMSVVAAFGACSAFGVLYAPLHNILPLILLGLGVDDMFVLVQSWENLDKSGKKKLEERLAETLQKAGVAICVTSFTDFMAFIIGAMTSLPALRSFCIYAAVGIAFLFTTQVTFFFACFTLDQRRIEANRNGFLWCIKHENSKQNSCSKRNTMDELFRKFSEFLTRKKTKVFVLLLTLTITSVSIWGMTKLRQEFDPVLFIPSSTYLFKFLSKALANYPEAGVTGHVFLESSALTSDLHKVEWLTNELQNSPVVSEVESWYPALQNYTLERRDLDISNKSINESLSSDILGDFVFSASGAKYTPFFGFDTKPTCGEDTPYIHATKIRYRHTYLDDRDKQIEAMDEVKAIVKRAGFSGFASPLAPAYCGWEGDKIIAYELAQNLSLALIAVLVMTSLLVANVVASILVFMCVLLTLIDVMALMAFWGLTIDTVTCINLVLCVGLSVDYSAHIALHFMKATGTRNERTIASFSEIGPAVFNGAFSTFLSFLLLCNSDSHVFLSFFKIFFGVFIFGIFQGLVFLPVILSIVGPPAYSDTVSENTSEATVPLKQRNGRP